LREYTPRYRLFVWSVYLLSLVLSGVVLYFLYLSVEAYFVIAPTSTAPPYPGGPAGGAREIPILSVAIAVITSRPALFYFYGLFLTLVFLNELSYLPLSVLHEYTLRHIRTIQPIDKWERIPMVSIIIPAYNEEKVIEGTVKTLLESDYPNKEIIVVNDGSTDNTEAVLRPYALQGKIRLINRPNGGKAKAINLGVSLATGEIIVSVDADGAIERGAITRLIANYQDPTVDAVGGNVKVGNRINLLTRLQALEYIKGLNLRRRAFDMLVTTDVIPGALASFRKSVFKLVGTFDSDTVTEDMDQTVKLLKGGRRVLYDAKAVVHTEAPEDLKSLFRQRKRWNSGTVMVLLKHSAYWWKHGALSYIAYPYLVLSTIIVPVAELTAFVLTFVYAALGRWIGMGVIFSQFLLLELALSATAIYLDKEDWQLILYVPAYALLYRYLLDIFRLATYVEMYRKKIGWTRADRYGALRKKIKIG